MSDTRRVVDGEDKTRVQPLRPAAPLDGPLAESGAAPDPAPAAVPRPRRPWLNSGTTDAKSESPASADAAPASTVDAPAADRGEDAADDIAAKVAPTADAADADTAAADTAGTATATADRAEGGADNPARDNTDGDDTTKADTTAVDPAKAKAKTGDGKAGTATTDDGTVAAGATDLTATKVDGVAVVPAVTPGRRRRVPFAHAVRLPPPRQAAVTAARATREWSRRPSGRLTVPGVFLLALVAATAAAGALLVPATIGGSKPVAVDASAAPTVAVPPALPLDPRPTGPLPTGMVPTGAVPTGAFPTGVVPTGPAVAPTVGGRPSDALAGWAQEVGAKVGIPPTAMRAYGYAEQMLAQTNRSCALSWTTLAAIGQVESGHGSANRAQLGADGKALPPIIGLPLDGNGGRMRIIDTDRGALDKDSIYDRAIGPMQFIPTTWQEIGADADGDGIKDPHDLDDAALAAGNYLCKGGRNLSIPGDWWNAILSYNDVRRYAQAVYDTADRYGRASRL
ncbi:lytic transglycosylase domain-containing protein [Micromonospora sp. NPDC051543]|uniref:lytic transglycosylase domain-containing protein n=1 Tax=Micromonospora sp. NPDC051543 TaxID=3364287 RepID=UPI0037876F7E